MYAAELRTFVTEVCERKHDKKEDAAWEWALQETDPAILESDGHDEHIETESIIEELEMEMDTALIPDTYIEPVSSASSIHEDQVSSYAGSFTERSRASSISSIISNSTTTPIASAFTQSLFSNPSSMQSQETLPRKLSAASPTLSSINEFDYVPFPTGSPPPPPPIYLSQTNGTTRTARSSSNACKLINSDRYSDLSRSSEPLTRTEELK